MNTFWRNDQPSMPIFHLFLCIFYKAQFDINNRGYHGNQMGNQMSFWNFKACFAVWGSDLLHTQRMRNIPDVVCRTPMRIFLFLQRIHVKSYHWDLSSDIRFMGIWSLEKSRGWSSYKSFLSVTCISSNFQKLWNLKKKASGKNTNISWWIFFCEIYMWNLYVYEHTLCTHFMHCINNI